MLRNGWLWVVVGIAGTVGGLGWFKVDQIRDAIAMGEAFPELHETVVPTRAERVAWRPTTLAAGTVVASRRADLRTEAAGTIREVGFAPGETVRAGQMLLRLDTEVEEAELRSARAQATLARSNLERARELVAREAGTAATLDRAAADLEAAEAQVALIEARIARRIVVAPFAGATGLHTWSPGQYLEAATLVTPLEGLDESIHVDFTLPQEASAFVTVGSTVELLGPDGTVLEEARVVATGAAITRTSRTLQYRAVADGPLRLLPGAYVDVRAVVGETVDAVSVPIESLRRAPYGDHVFRLVGVDGETRAEQVIVETGAVLNDRILVLDGLAAGDAIAGVGAFKLRDGVLVRTRDEAGTPDEIARAESAVR